MLAIIQYILQIKTGTNLQTSTLSLSPFPTATGVKISTISIDQSRSSYLTVTMHEFQLQFVDKKGNSFRKEGVV